MKNVKNFQWNPEKLKSFTEISEFSCMFAKHRNNYIKSVEKYIQKALKDKSIDFKLSDNTMIVRTTNETRDPFIIIKANEMLELIAKGFSLENASMVLEEDVFSDIITIQRLCTDKTFENRKTRLSNPKVIEALELLTKTKILVIHKVVAVVGNYKGIEMVKKVVLDCFEKNIHPAYKIREFIIKNNLLKDKVEGDWERFIPKIKKSK